MTFEIARTTFFIRVAITVFVIGNLSCFAFAQGAGQNHIEISTSRSSISNSNFKFISPADCLPAALTRPLKTPAGKIRLKELAAIIAKESGVTCRVDVEEIKGDKLSPDVEVEIDAEIPLYAALDHAFNTQFDGNYGWLFEHGILTLTTRRESSEHYLTKTFDVKKLLKSEVDHRVTENLIPFLYAQTEGPWFGSGQEGGTLTLSGDMLIARHSFRQLIEIGQILKAIEDPSHETYFINILADANVIGALNSAWSVDDGDVPLERALESWSSFSKVKYRMDDALRECLKQAVTCRFAGIRSQDALQQLLESAGVDRPFVFPDQGRLRIVSVQEFGRKLITCDVRDLLPHYSVNDLILAFQQGTQGPWFDLDAEGGTVTSLNGCLLIRQEPYVLEECVEILREIREHIAVRNAEDQIDPQAVETRYYRLPEKEARELYRSLPRLVAPETWGKAQIELLSIDLVPTDPNAIPAKRLSWVDTVQKDGVFFKKPEAKIEPKNPANAVCESHPIAAAPIPKVTLIIRQTHAVHQQVDRFINELFYGQPAPTVDRLQTFKDLPFSSGTLSTTLSEEAAPDR